MSNPLVTVVIPLYNKVRVLKRTIDSVLSQTFQDFEIIIVDDGSTDESGVLAQSLAKTDRRISVLVQENRGPGVARNTGLAASKGKYISFLDADDEYMPRFLEMAIAKFRENQEIKAFAASHYRTWKGEKRSYSEYFKNFGVSEGVCRIDAHCSAYFLLGLVWFYHSSAVVCEKEVVQKYGGYFADYKCTFGEDSYLWVQVIINECGYCCMEPLAWYRTEDSDLCGAQGQMSLPPSVNHQMQLKKSCPTPTHDLIDRYIQVVFQLWVFSCIFTAHRSSHPPLRAQESADRTNDLRDLLMLGELYSGAYSDLNEIIFGPKFGKPWVDDDLVQTELP